MVIVSTREGADVHVVNGTGIYIQVEVVSENRLNAQVLWKGDFWTLSFRFHTPNGCDKNEFDTFIICSLCQNT